MPTKVKTPPKVVGKVVPALPQEVVTPVSSSPSPPPVVVQIPQPVPITNGIMRYAPAIALILSILTISGLALAYGEFKGATGSRLDALKEQNDRMEKKIDGMQESLKNIEVAIARITPPSAQTAGK